MIISAFSSISAALLGSAHQFVCQDYNVHFHRRQMDFARIQHLPTRPFCLPSRPEMRNDSMKNVIAIRREDLSKKGEQRVAVTPNYMRLITEAGHTVLVQPGMHPVTHEVKRAHRDTLYTQVGAQIQEDISAADVIVGLKEIGLEYIYPDKVYYCFSHTHKGQLKNRKMLQAFVDNRTTLIDYELVTNGYGERTVTAFTYFAGYAGMIDTLWTMGQRLHGMGKEHPFYAIPQAIRHDDLDEFKRLLAEVGENIEKEGTPTDQPPLICVFLGKGKTSKGAQEILDILPTKRIRPDAIAETFAHGSRHLVYVCVMEIADMFKPMPSLDMDLTHWAQIDPLERRDIYLSNPNHFESTLADYLPYASIVMNCVIWAPKYPRTITKAIMQQAWHAHHQPIVIGDISCDPNGSVEFSMDTWIDNPVFIYHPDHETANLGMTGEGVAVMAVTNLPCEFSKDSSEQFSKDLAHVIPSIATADYQGTLAESDLDDELKRAVIMWQGEFTPAYAYMKEYLAVNA
jgi:alanine dehydrogenase